MFEKFVLCCFAEIKLLCALRAKFLAKTNTDILFGAHKKNVMIGKLHSKFFIIIHKPHL